MDKSTGTHPSLEDKRALPNCGNKDGNIIHVFEMTVPICHWCLVITNVAHDLHLKSHQRCSTGIRTCLSADQSSSSTLTESSFLFDPCLIHRDTVMLE